MPLLRYVVELTPVRSTRFPRAWSWTGSRDPFRTATGLLEGPHDRHARQSARLFRDAVPAQNRFPDARRFAAEGAGDFGAMAEARPLRGAADRGQGPAALRAAR